MKYPTLDVRYCIPKRYVPQKVVRPLALIDIYEQRAYIAG
jgi:hypothetical protein